MKTSAHLGELIEVKAGDRVQTFQRLDNRPGRHHHSGLLGQHGHQPVAHGSCAKSDDGGARRPDHDIRACSAGTLRRPVERAVADADERENHRELNRDCQNA